MVGRREAKGRHARSSCRRWAATAAARPRGRSRCSSTSGRPPQTLGAPIHDRMEPVVVGEAEGCPVYADRAAVEADHILIVNRVKEHTGVHRRDRVRPDQDGRRGPGPCRRGRESCTSSRCGSAMSRPSRRWPGSCSKSFRFSAASPSSRTRPTPCAAWRPCRPRPCSSASPSCSRRPDSTTPACPSISWTCCWWTRSARTSRAPASTPR